MMKEAFNMPNSITIVTQLYNYLHKMDWLLSKHFDVRGLIPKDLAIAVTEENNVVYWRVLVFIEESRIK